MIRPETRLHWDAQKGFIVYTKIGLSQNQMERIAMWALPRAIDRYRGMPQGDLKEQFGKSIKQLKEGQIRQLLVGDADLFKSTERMSTRSYF